ncbi:MAG: aldo/keto reductase [Promethearchaeota archaeon]
MPRLLPFVVNDVDPRLDLDSTIEINNCVAIPVLGLGTWMATGKAAERAVEWALQAGYRHVDTATIYGNEAEVGRAIAKFCRESGVSRDEIFVTTKLWNDSHGRDAALRAIDRSLKALKLSQVDLYLIHWPVPGRRVETWHAMEEILGAEKARAIGVSNFMEHHLDELLPHAEVVPAVNQVEFSPFLYLRDLQKKCEDNGIVVEAYSPLTRGVKLGDPRLVEVANKYGKTPAQVLVRWGLQKGLVVIPKSTSEARIRENADVFDFNLSAEDVASLDALDEGFHAQTDPDWIPTSDRWK